MQGRLVLSISIGLMLLSGCGGSDKNIENDIDLDRSNLSQVASFSPSTGAIPFPSNLLFSDSADGTVNIPGLDETDESDPQVAINTLDGFSTIAPISTQLSQAIDAATLTGESVKLYEVTLTPQAVVTSVVRALNYGSEYVASVSSVDPETKTLVISPLAPLKPKTGYMVALTTAIQSTDGNAVRPSATYTLAKQSTPLVDDQGNSQSSILSDADAQALEPLRQLINVQETRLAGQGLASDIVALSWTFSTQSIGDVLGAVRSVASGSTANFQAIGDTSTLLGLPSSAVDIYAGTLTLPYYLSNADASSSDPLNKHWQGMAGSQVTQFNTTVVKTSDETVPLLLNVPKLGSAPWPVVIFQHGVTRDRSDVLAVADALASAGFASVAIDMPLHGITDSSHGLYSGIERSFDLDLVNNNTGAPGPDQQIDASGTHYINLSYLATTRDNVRQSVADLFALYSSLATLDYDGGGADLDTSRVYFAGHSLGAMVGVPFLALEPGVRDAVLAMPGSGIAKLLDNSGQFGTTIAAGLAAAGVNKGTPDYESFMGAAQALVDSGDPANYAAAAANGRGVLLFEVIGDQTIPNNVTTDLATGTVPAPLSGTDPLIALLGLSQVSTASASASDMLSVVRFNSGYHGSLLDPSLNELADAAVTTVMQGAMAAFLASDGLQTVISDTSVVEQ